MQHKKDWGPGYRFFKCENCNVEFKEKSRHCQSPSLSICETCHDEVSPIAHEEHYEWGTDKSQNLKE